MTPTRRQKANRRRTAQSTTNAAQATPAPRQPRTGASAGMRLKRSAEDIITIGQDLITAKEQLAHGQFGAWLTAEFEMSQPTALRFMQVADRFGDKIVNLTNMPSSVIYQLAAPSTPDTVIDRVTSGEVAPKAAYEQVKRASGV